MVSVSPSRLSLRKFKQSYKTMNALARICVMNFIRRKLELTAVVRVLCTNLGRRSVLDFYRITKPSPPSLTSLHFFARWTMQNSLWKAIAPQCALVSSTTAFLVTSYMAIEAVFIWIVCVCSASSMLFGEICLRNMIFRSFGNVLNVQKMDTWIFHYMWKYTWLHVLVGCERILNEWTTYPIVRNGFFCDPSI